LRHPLAWLLGAAALVVYALTLAHGLGWDDSGELQTGVLQLEPVHSAGYAPYVWLGHVFTVIVPLGSDATRVNLWSAVCAALAVALAARYVLVVAGSRAGAAVAALVLGAGPIFIYNATVASVYCYLALAVALLLNAADAWWRRPSRRRLALFALAIGLVAMAHAAGLGFAVGGAVLIALRRPRLREAYPLAAVLIPLAAVPLLAAVGDEGGGGDPRSQSSLWDAVSRVATNLAESLANKHGIVVHSWWLVLTLVVSLSPAAFVLVPAGLRRLWSERPYLVCCLGPALVASAIAVFQRGGYAYWHVPLILAGALACGVGVSAVRGTAARAALGAALLVCPLFGALYLAHSHREAGGWSQATLEALPRGARLVAPWIAYTPLRAQQVLDGVRSDVRLELTPTGAPVDVTTLRGEYAVAVTGGRVAAPPAGPAAGANFKGLSGLEWGPFGIGFDAVRARAYRLAP
jgi:hypothetical protein